VRGELPEPGAFATRTQDRKAVNLCGTFSIPFLLRAPFVSLDDLLKARSHTLDAERRRERVLPLRLMFPSGWGKGSAG